MPHTRVVVVDDSPVYRAALAAVLQRVLSMTVVAMVEDGDEALQLVTETTPDLVLLDIQMPKGYEVLQRLRNTQARVVALSSYADAYYQQRALEHGAVAYVPKGNVPQLLETIRQLIPTHDAP